MRTIASVTAYLVIMKYQQGQLSVTKKHSNNYLKHVWNTYSELY